MKTEPPIGRRKQSPPISTTLPSRFHTGLRRWQPQPENNRPSMELLALLASDTDVPAIIRASAASRLQLGNAQGSVDLLKRLSNDSDALVRWGAARALLMSRVARPAMQGTRCRRDIGTQPPPVIGGSNRETNATDARRWRGPRPSPARRTRRGRRVRRCVHRQQRVDDALRRPGVAPSAAPRPRRAAAPVRGSA